MRHGQTDANLGGQIQGQNDVPLNDTGRAQATMALGKIVPLGIKRIVSSDLSRAAETAGIIASQLNITVEYDPRLREYNFGDLGKMQPGQIGLDIIGVLLSTPQKINAEPIPDMFARISSFLNEIDKNQNTLIVSHGGTMRVMMYYLQFGKDINPVEFVKFARARHIDNAQIFAFRNKKFELVR
jgi:broad specificity phosphatase PhoE